MVWAHGKYSKGAVKMHTLLNLRGNIPTFIHITDGKYHDVNALDEIGVVAGAAYVMDKSRKHYPDKIRRIKYYDAEKDIRLVFLTNDFELAAIQIASVYKSRWQIEVFFYAKYIVMQSDTRSDYWNRVFPCVALPYRFA